MTLVSSPLSFQSLAEWNLSRRPKAIAIFWMMESHQLNTLVNFLLYTNTLLRSSLVQAVISLVVWWQCICISVDFGLFDTYHQSSCRYFPGVFGFWPKIRISYDFSLIPAQLSVTCRMESVEKTQGYSNLLNDGVSPAEYFSQLSPLHKHSPKIFLGAGCHQLSCLMAMYM